MLPVGPWRLFLSPLSPSSFDSLRFPCNDSGEDLALIVGKPTTTLAWLPGPSLITYPSAIVQGFCQSTLVSDDSSAGTALDHLILSVA
jgi:hypothetical protein